ncbi:proline--tRNA ligase-like isoform X3 [Juglans microcarpa x Juglans regia]|uniref:proline--tRNA ligase-like isoform X3 n=1 Tax=Juglans microcarpa x Juglans regia TaxID=2249226 RepID=UPI001B7ED6FC|nr:proline--tRNA ligase-like isoform X3 [Juglans microcarpa x Juglans regia]
MGYSKDQLLARLQELKIEFSQYEHPVVMKVEAQEKYVRNTGGGLSKNLFLKDKKNRFYVVSALADTKVDLKVLSQRLGLGKGGLRMAPEEALGEILQVPLGCVTPFALINDSARHVSLLLDQGFKDKEHCLFHPLSNDMAIYLLEKAASVQGPTKDHAVSVSKSMEITVKSAEPSRKVKNVKGKPVGSVQPSNSFKDVGQYVEEILDKTSALLLSEITEDTIKQHGERLGAVVSNCIRERLSAELKADTRSYLNAAYTEGFGVACMMFQNTGSHNQFRCL